MVPKTGEGKDLSQSTEEEAAASVPMQHTADLQDGAGKICEAHKHGKEGPDRYPAVKN